MNFMRIISLIILIFLYILAINDTITLYYITGADSFVSHIYPSLIIYIVLIKAFPPIMILIGGISLIIRAYKPSPPAKPPFYVVSWISGIFTVLIIINNYISGVWWYSAILLIIGMVFTMVSFNLRRVGKGSIPVKESSYGRVKKPQYIREFEGLCDYIMELELFRSPVPRGITPYSLRSWGIMSWQMQKHYFRKANPGLYQELCRSLDPFFQKAIYSYPFNAAPGEYFLRYSLRYNLNLHRIGRRKHQPHFTDPGLNSMDAGFPLVNYLIISMLVVLLGLKFLSILDILNTFSMVCMTSIAYIGIYIYFFFINTRRRQFWGEKYEDNLNVCAEAHR